MDGINASSIDQPLDKQAGLSTARERKWGWIGGTVGSLVGVGSALVALGIDGVPWYSAGPYPLVFTEQRLLGLDVYLMMVFLAGLGFSAAGAVNSRRSPYPRTDAFGAGLMGTILMGVSGLVLFTRLAALILS